MSDLIAFLAADIARIAALRGKPVADYLAANRRHRRISVEQVRAWLLRHYGRDHPGARRAE